MHIILQDIAHCSLDHTKTTNHILFSLYTHSCLEDDQNVCGCLVHLLNLVGETGDECLLTKSFLVDESSESTIKRKAQDHGEFIDTSMPIMVETLIKD